jgi:hypothetical protein
MLLGYILLLKELHMLALVLFCFAAGPVAPARLLYGHDLFG